MIKISIVGDFFPGGQIANKSDICAPEVENLLSESNIRVATLESAFGDGLPFDEEKMSNPNWRNIVFAPNYCLNKLNDLHFDVVTLANNHIFDLGEQGLINTISLLNDMGVAHCGAGINAIDAAKPAVVHCKNKTVAFLGYMVYFEGWRAPHPASDNKPGINVFNMNKAIRDVKKAKELYDYVFVLPHWGTEYSMLPTPEDVSYAHELIKAGADGIVGSHAHQIQPLSTYKAKPIFYNLGNFIFPDFCFDESRATCYPDNQDAISQIPITYQYERFPKELMLRVWPIENRRGVIGNIEIGDKEGVVANVIHVILNNQNVLELERNFPYEKKMARLSIIVDTFVYKLYYYMKCRLRNKIAYIINLLK